MFAACNVLDWPRFADVDPSGEVWRLAVAAMKEIQTLSLLGKAGQLAAENTTETALANSLAAWERQMLPLDLQAFNRFHHGRKVNAQDRALLNACRAAGQSEGKDMNALSDLLARTAT